MSIATTTTDPYDIALFLGRVSMTITGPVAGLWTIDAPDIPQATLDAVLVRYAVEQSYLANASALVAKARAALIANATFLALAAPTNAQVVAQTKLLTRQVNALIKLRVQGLADIDGT